MSGNFGEYSEAWFKDKNNYTIGTTDKKVYIRYNDGSASVNLEGLTFKLRYNVKARESNDFSKGEIDFSF